MANATKSIISLVALLFFVGAMIITGMGIFELSRTKNDSISQEYLVPAAIMNTLSVVFLLYLTATLPDASTAYKLLIVFLLVGGLIMEIYLSLFSEQKVVSVFAYIIMVINFLFRGFLVLQYVQMGDWVQPEWAEMKPIAQITKPIEKAAETVKSAVTEPKPSVDTQDKAREFKDLWRRIRKDVEEKNPTINRTSVQSASGFINRSIEDGSYGKDKIRQALKMMKNEDGSNITEVPIGGKRS
jgi:hypothetical protein